MAKCIGCNKEKGARHSAACQTRPGRLKVREQDCVMPEKMKESLDRNALSYAIHHEGTEAMQERITELLAPIMAEAEVLFAKERNDTTTDLWKDIERAHTCDEEEYIDAVLERCASWLKDRMPRTFEELQAYNRKTKDTGGVSIHIN